MAKRKESSAARIQPEDLVRPAAQADDRMGVSRDNVAAIVKAVMHGADDSAAPVRVVDTLELLLEAGQIHAAERLVSWVRSREGGARAAASVRSDLFRGYQVFFEVLLGDSLRNGLCVLEEIYHRAQQGHFSVQDQVRAGLLLARLLALGAHLSALSATDMQRARVLMNEACAQAFEHGYYELGCQVGTELARTYLNSLPSELISAAGVVEYVHGIATKNKVSADVRFDIECQRFLVDMKLQPADGTAHVWRVEQLRQQASGVGKVAQGLAELFIARGHGVSTAVRAEARRSAIRIFRQQHYPAGLFEVLYAQGLLLAQAECWIEAKDHFWEAQEVAAKGGIGFAECLAGVSCLRLQVAHGKRSELESSDVLKEVVHLRLRCQHDLAATSSGLTLAAVLQLAGRHGLAEVFLKSLERTFRRLELHDQESQALFMRGTLMALEGDWPEAEQLWRKAQQVDRRRGALLAAADKQAAVAQAIAMAEYHREKKLSPATLQRVHGLLEKAAAEARKAGEGHQHIQVVGRILHSKAQLCLMAQRPLDAIAELGRARSEYERLEMFRDVALTDALTGMAFLEVAKGHAGTMFEEAYGAFERAVRFYGTAPSPKLRWKIKYFLALSGLMASRHAADPQRRDAFAQRAYGWLQGAYDDLQSVDAGISGARRVRSAAPGGAGSGRSSSQGEPEVQLDPAASGFSGEIFDAQADFSPSLQPEDLAALRDKIQGSLVMPALQAVLPSTKRVRSVTGRKIRSTRERRVARRYH